MTASDSFNTGSDVSNGPFIVPNHPPQITIISPAANNLFTASQAVIFASQTLDLDGDPIAESTIKWRSSLDGVDPNPLNSRVTIATSIVRIGGPLVADYQFQNSFASSIPGAPALTNLGVGNAFVRESVEGLDRTVLRFPQGNGLSLPSLGSLVPGNTYSIAVLFRLKGVRPNDPKLSGHAAQPQAEKLLSNM